MIPSCKAMSTPVSLLRLAWTSAKPYQGKLLIQCVVALYTGISFSLSAYIVKMILDRATVSGEVPWIDSLWIAIVYYLLASLVTEIVWRTWDWLHLQISPRIASDIGLKGFVSLAEAPYSYFQDHLTGELSNQLNNLMRTLPVMIEFPLQQVLPIVVGLVIAVTTLAWVYPPLGWIMLIWSLVYAAGSTFIAKRAKQYSAQASSKLSRALGHVVDSLSNILVVKLFVRGRFESRYFGDQLAQWVTSDQKSQWFLLNGKIFFGACYLVLMGGLFFSLAFAQQGGHVTVGDFGLVLTLATTISERIWTLDSALVVFWQDLGVCRHATDLLIKREPQPDRTLTLQVQRGTIDFREVHFEHHKGQNLFLNTSVSIGAGEKVGLVGYSGSGKSTFVNLILGFYSPQSGHILIDGQDLEKVSLDSLRSQIAVIPQDPHLFHRSIKENIRYGQLDASDAQIVECATRTHCNEFVRQLPHGYDTVVGERGVKLSGGQRQRIAIARAFIKKAPILILDEATSAMDSLTEAELQESLYELIEGRTTLIIAHRLSTLEHVDRILVFDGGVIVADGTRAQLLETCPLFAKMWSAQTGGFLKDDLGGTEA